VLVRRQRRRYARDPRADNRYVKILVPIHRYLQFGATMTIARLIQAAPACTVNLVLRN
jgi:hypothetical protein